MKTKLCILLLLCPLMAAAQFKGRVVDEAGQPVPYANAALLSARDSALRSVVVAEADGRFSLPVKPDAGLLRLSGLGYQTTFVKVSAAKTALGDLCLKADGLMLSEAVVTAKRPVAKMTGEGLETTVSGTTLEKAGTAEDLLQKIPGVVKKDDKIEVLGRGNPIIYVNGRQVRDNSELQRLNSDEIKSVEVITSPGARYDASVSSVVRIRTVRRKGEGFGVDALANYSQGKSASAHGQLNLTYRKNSLEWFFNSDYKDYKGKMWESNDQITQVDTLWSLPFTGNTSMKVKSYTLGTGFNYDIAPGHSLGLRYDFSHTFHDHTNGSLLSQIKANGEYYDELASEVTTREDNDPTHMVNAYYVGKIGRGELSVNADFYADGETNDQRTLEQSVEADNRDVHSTEFIRNRLVAGKADYKLPVWGGSLTFGGQYTHTDRHDDYLIPINNWGVATSRSQLREQNAAGFVEYSKYVAKVGMLTAGLRYEHIDFDYYSGGVRQPEQSRVFDNVFPNLSLATMLGKMQFMAAYSVKTMRPSYFQLSNNVTYANRFLQKTGNPSLAPTIAHDLTLTGVWKFLQGSVSFKHSKDGIIFWGISLPEQPATTKITHINKSYSEMQYMLTAAPKFGLWQPSVTGVLMHSWVKMPAFGAERKFNNPLFVGVWNNAFNLPGGFVFNLDYRYQSPGNYQNVYLSKNVHYLGVALSKSFFKDALTITAKGNDLFHSAQRVNIFMENSRMIYYAKADSRRFELTLRYKFNTSRSKYRGQSAAGSEIDRFSNNKQK